MTAPHTPPAALDVAAIGDLMGADEARSLLDAETSKRCRYCVRAASRHRRAHGRRRVIPLDRVRELLAAYGAAHDEATRGDATSALYGAAPDLARDVLSLAAALATAERERDAALAERDTLRALTDSMRADNVRLRGIVESVRSARAVSAAAAARYTAAWDAVGTLPPTAAQSEEIAAALRAAYEAGDALTAALDAAGEGR